MKTLATIIEGVTENNENNGASWAGWDSAEHIFDVYLDSESEYDDHYGSIDEAKRLLNNAIQTNGDSVEADFFELKSRHGLI